MSTATEEQPAATSTGFQFDGAGNCTNPEKVIVQVGELGAACALLVARNREGRWWSGYQIGGRNLAYVTVTPGAAGAGGTRIGFDTRADALAHAAQIAAEPLVGLHATPAAVAILAALEKRFGAVAQGVATPSETRDDWTPAPNKEGFIFDNDGHCTNPERIEIPCLPGYQCALLVAQMADGQWTFGAIRAGKDEEIFKCPAQLIANGEIDRESALETALVVALENGAPGSPINVALEKWRAGRSTELAQEVGSKIEESRQAHLAETNVYQRIDYALVCPAAKELVEAGEAATGIAVKLALSGRQVHGVLKRLGLEGPGPWDSKPAPAPSEHPAADFSAFGGLKVCTNPETIRVPMPEGVECVVLLARAKNGKWAVGYSIQGVDRPQTNAMCQGTCAIHATRAEALRQASHLVFRDCVMRKSIETVAAIEAFALSAGAPFREPVGKLTREEAIEDLREQEPNEGALAFWMEYGARYKKSCEELAAIEHVPKKKFKGDEAQVHSWRLAELRWEIGMLESELVARAGKDPKAEDGATPPTLLPGMSHKTNQHGVFLDPERVKIPMPTKDAHCEIRLAVDEEGKWRFGYDYGVKAGKESGAYGSSGPVSRSAAPFGDRRSALVAGLVQARDYFREGVPPSRKKIADRALFGITGFMTEIMGDSSPANKARGDASGWVSLLGGEPPAPRVAPVYRTEFAELPVAKIQENPNNNRKHYNAIKVRELADSLLSEGLHQPIAVRRLLDGEQPEGELPLGDPSAPEYECIFGHRRRRAALIAGIPSLQSKIYHGLTRQQATPIALIENLQREDINAMEEAEAYQQLMTDLSLTQEGCADRVGRARSTVAHALGLLRLPEGIREALHAGGLNFEHGKALLRFVPTKKQEPQWATEFPNWAAIVGMMADLVHENKIPSAAIEKGVPFVAELTRAGVAVRIDQFGVHKVEKKQRDHAAYFQTTDGDWVSFAPDHWGAEVKERERRADEREEKARQEREAELAKLTKGGRKQINLQDLDAGAYRKFEGVHESLVSLVPADKKAHAKDRTGRTTVITDVELADRLRKAMEREIRKNREASLYQIEEKALKSIAKIKKIGPREFAWLVSLLVNPNCRGMGLQLGPDACAGAGVKVAQVPTGARAPMSETDRHEQRDDYEEKRLRALAKSDAASVLRVLMCEALQGMLVEVADIGPDSLGGRTLKWWLDTDTLWLLEETEEGRAELVEAVKNSSWYAKAIAGESTEGEA